jgi:PAS domain-containing protein
MPQVLYLGKPDPLFKSRRILLEHAGYKVNPIHRVEVAIKRRAWHGCALVILAKLIPTAQRERMKALAEADGIGVLDLASSSHYSHSTEGLPDDGPNSFLERVGHAAMASHHHPEVAGDNVAWVDRERRYIHVTDGFLRMIGYDRDEVLGCFIDDFTYPGTADAAKQFHHYLKDGRQAGRYFLRHKAGMKVEVSYEAGVLEDGCMYSSLRVLNEKGACRAEDEGNREDQHKRSA